MAYYGWTRVTIHYGTTYEGQTQKIFDLKGTAPTRRSVNKYIYGDEWIFERDGYLLKTITQDGGITCSAGMKSLMVPVMCKNITAPTTPVYSYNVYMSWESLPYTGYLANTIPFTIDTNSVLHIGVNGQSFVGNELSTGVGEILPWLGRTQIHSIDIAGNIKLSGNIEQLFRGYSGAESITNVNRIDTSDVTNTSFLFEYCKGITELDISNMDFSKSTKVNAMFADCSELKTIYASKDISFASATDDSLFANDTNLVGGKGTSYDGDTVSDRKLLSRASIDNPPDSPGYFTPVNGYGVRVQVKVDGAWEEGELKAKVNGEWVDADAAYVKVNGAWIEIN